VLYTRGHQSLPAARSSRHNAFRFSAHRLARAVALAVATTSPSLALALDDFRVLPYLQQPGSDGMLFTWFTSSSDGGTLSIEGPGLSSPLSFSSAPSNQAVLGYTQAELNQNISGLPQGSWLYENSNFKHSVDVRDLLPNSTYSYTSPRAAASSPRASARRLRPATGTASALWR
jgi:hypothetical protein